MNENQRKMALKSEYDFDHPSNIMNKQIKKNIDALDLDYATEILTKLKEGKKVEVNEID